MSTPVPSSGPPSSPSRRSPWRVAVLVLVAVLAVGVVLMLLGRVMRETRVETAVYRQPLSQVVVETSTGSIEVRPAVAGSPVTVQRTLESSFGSAESQEGVSGGVLSAQGRCGQRLGFGTCSVSYVVTLPPTTTVNVTSSTGAVRVRDLSGEVHARTSTGSVDLTGLRSSTVAAETGTGSVLVRFAAPPSSVSARAGTGSVKVVLPADGTAYDVSATTSTGRRSVSVPVDAASTRHVTASTSTGSVEVRSAS